ncbi:MAG: hypothetical protein J6N55_00205 [Anaerovibrio sp.]|jgi:hypothetical protein|uniref:hypothetical protein n=1 Tax=Anaerovibrio TaxID=82373 RepID=UPI000487E15F|nr:MULTISPECIES: hypothetical protein [Anaerovibrio]MBO6244686.1 hypothetical protein [Anaerovibrio sp.]
MSGIPEDVKASIKDILNRERWQGYVSGKIEGTLDVLNLMDVDKEKQITILMNVVGLSRATSLNILKSREREEDASIRD